MSRKQARIDRQNAKTLKQQEKTARLVEMVVSEQIPRVAIDPSANNLPRAAIDPQASIMQLRMEYRIHEHSDRAGTWSWGHARNWCDAAYGPENACMIRATMIEMSGLYWHEIMAQQTGGRDRHRKHHSQPLDSLCEEAQLRWIEIDREEDELFRFRTGGKQRIWGFRTGHVFNVVWWDADHQIYPVD